MIKFIRLIQLESDFIIFQTTYPYVKMFVVLVQRPCFTNAPENIALFDQKFTYICLAKARMRRVII